jgi:hypothetical protein
MSFWDQILNVLRYVCAGVALLFVIWLVVAAIRYIWRVEIVDEKKRLAIYRLGRFHRIAGPGPVLIIQPLDRRVEEFDIAERPRAIMARGIFLQDQPMRLVLNLRYAFDPQGTISQDRNRLIDTFEMSAGEREQQVEIRIGEALHQQIQRVMKRYPLPENPSIIDKLMPVLPGTEQRSWLLQQLRLVLPAMIRPLGFRLSQTEPILITDIYPPDDVLQAFQERRSLDLIVGSLRQSFPDLSEKLLVQMFSAIRGLEGFDTKIWELYQEGSARVSVREKDGDAMYIGEVLEEAEIVEQPKPPPSQPISPGTVHDDSRRLSKSDLSILKRVPGT